MIIDISTKIGTTSNQGGFKGLLDVYSGAAAAYSLRKLSKATTSVVRVRRDSDNAEADFTAQEITDGTLEAWVNTDVVKYTSDFTSGNEDLLEVNGTGTDGETIAGVSDAYKFELTGGNSLHLAQLYGSSVIGASYKVDLEYYIPSTNTAVNKIAIGYGPDYIENQQSILDSWTSVSVDIGISDNTNIRVFANSGGLHTFSADGDVFYLKNIVITQTTSDGLVTTWYDQSGNGNDATQATASAQPKIVSAGVLVTDNGKAALQLTESSLETNLSLTQNQIHYLFSVLKTNDSAGIQYWSHNTNNQWVFILEQGSSSIVVSDRFSINSIDKNGVSQSLSTRNDWYNAFGDNNKHLSVLVGKASLSNWNSLGFFGYTGLRLNGFSQEIIIWDSDQSANRSGIEANINKAFNIYWDGTQKGLLDTYTGAEAAYSLRALNSAYTGAIIKVRRASDNAEQDIYAKWDGTLNVEALETFCAATDGYVVTWYDQSGNANNATQATAASQPQIVSSGSIITDSGYQVIQYDGSDDNLGTSFTATGTMLMGGADAGAFYEVAISGAYNLLANAANTDHPLKESIRVIWGRTLSAGEQSAIESRVTYSDWDFSDVAIFLQYWRSRVELTSFPLIDVSSGTNFIVAWYDCTSLTSFPALDVSSGTNFFQTWRFCTSLEDFPANMFDSVTATNFTNAFANTNLTQTSIDNILVSIDTAGQSGGTFDQSGGSAPSATGEAAIDNLRARGWTVTVTGGY